MQGFPSPCEAASPLPSLFSPAELLIASLFKICLIALGTRQAPNKRYYYFMGHWAACWSQAAAYREEIYFLTASLHGTQEGRVIWHRSAQRAAAPGCHGGVSALRGVAGIQVRPREHASQVSLPSQPGQEGEALLSGVLLWLRMKEW